MMNGIYNSRIKVGDRPNSVFSTSFQDDKISVSGFSPRHREIRAITPRTEMSTNPHILVTGSEMSAEGSLERAKENMGSNFQNRSERLKANMRPVAIKTDSDSTKPSMVMKGKTVNVKFKNQNNSEIKNMKIEMKDGKHSNPFLVTSIHY